jgi:hypothetical protein
VQPGSYSAGRLGELTERVRAARTRALQLLGVEKYPTRLHIFFINSREEMRRLTGRGSTGWTDPESHVVLLVDAADWNAFERHEIMHAISLDLWGRAREPGEWLQEGVAAFAENRCGPYTGRQMAAGYLIARRIVGVPALIERFREHPDLVAYLGAGALAEFLHEHYGLKAVRVVWREGPAALPQVTGRPTSVLEREWHAWLGDTADPVPAAELRRLDAKGCG